MIIRKTLITMVVSVVLLFVTTNVMGQGHSTSTAQSSANVKHCHSIDDIWKFAKPNNKKHAVLTIMGLKVGDTLSMRIDGELVINNRIYSSEDSLQYADINGRMDECFFLVYYVNNLLRTIYNSRNCSEYTTFKRKKTKNASCEVEFLFNGQSYPFLFQLKDRWHIILIGRDTREVYYYSKEYFRGID